LIFLAQIFTVEQQIEYNERSIRVVIQK